VSGVIALANPRRIKASHRRRRRVASDHLLYILNNPLSGTDPSGYAATNCSDVTNGTAGSGTCEHTLSNGKTVSVDYKIGKGGSIAVSTTAANLSAIATDNSTRSLSGATTSSSANAVTTANGNGQPSQIGSTSPKAENTPMGKDNDMYRSSSNEITKEAYAQNRIVTLMFSMVGQSQISFQWDVRDEIISRTGDDKKDVAGFEHAGAFTDLATRLLFKHLIRLLVVCLASI
jgi:hypothetical protein